MAYQTRRCLKFKHREALRAVLGGSTYAHAGRVTGLAASTVAALVYSHAGRAFLERERERADAHRVLLAATLPYLELTQAASSGRCVRLSMRRNRASLG